MPNGRATDGTFTSEQRGILATTIVVSGLTFLMGTSLPVALPTLQAEFHATVAHLQWITNAGLLAISVLTLVGGTIGDHYGWKRIYQTGIILFSLGAILSALAVSVGQLVAFQILQGVGAALLVPGGLAIINLFFPERVRGRAMGLWVGLSLSVAAIGPLFAGVLIELFGWRAIFALQAPVSIAALLLARRFVPALEPQPGRRFDLTGVLAIGVALLGISYGLIQGPAAGWRTVPVQLGLAGGVLSFLLFLMVERRVPNPAVPFAMFRIPLVAGANLATLLLYFILSGMIFFLALNLQQVQGYAPARAGLAILPAMLPIILFSGRAGTLADRIGPRRPMVLGSLLVAAGMGFLMSAGTDAAYAITFLPGLLLHGTGMALVVPALTKSALAAAPEFSGVASGVNNAIGRIAGLLAVAILGALVLPLFRARLEANLTVASLSPEARVAILSQAARLGGIEIPPTLDETARVRTQSSIRSAFVAGFRGAMGVNAALALGSAVVSAVLIRRRGPY